MKRPFKLVDVFGTDPFTGNPLAVIADGEDLDTEDMQRITRWLNLSETTFLLPPTRDDADYRVRIFTLAHELPFAGHPTLGTCHAWLEAGGRPKREGIVVQECGVGLVEIRREAERLAFAAPPLIRDGVPTEAEVAKIAEALRVDPEAIVEARWVDNGPGWIAVLLSSAEAVLAIDPIRHHPERLDIGIVGPHAPGGEAAFEVRALFTGPDGSLIEDPVTGSLNASVAQWLFSSGRARDHYVAAQGTRLGRSGRVDLRQDASGQVWVGGRTRTLFSGQG
ncbi:PhzF family phenazine biosynthesis protein [Novosphingobium mangrovi (ex Huang et al. 2023)]|uniref:PhzF family phenazine biosynthesis protein n=1 Tax=Novosphingobium mangrovi (ex Huang et al. 2023) TaxID=2976432 RepID=A0ABT2I9J4_9SPHN|nr:PhzF family phenazine biosynthesis protein [Novosphingobium mangrovi (ex Huang et al. 2023)]MCT2401489.1 PhzF family phenazine biosynthesis protein [Novosphingobium mangrovi (ex Huang et al. 2023)]